MARKINVDKVIRILREVEVLQSQGKTIGEACRKLEITEHTYYRWKKEFGRLEADQAKRLKELETENVSSSRRCGSCFVAKEPFAHFAE